MSLNSSLRSYTLTRRGKFGASHYLPGYQGDCANLHGHTWHVEVIIEFPVIDIEDLTGETADGLLLDFHDIDEAWYHLDHGRCGPEGLNSLFENPTAEIIANWILHQVCTLVEDNVPDTPFHVTVVLDEDEDSTCACSMYMAPLFPSFPDDTDVEKALRHRDCCEGTPCGPLEIQGVGNVVGTGNCVKVSP